MQKEYYQESKSDYRAIINSTHHEFSKEITINSISGIFEISSVSSDDSYISGRRLIENIKEIFFLNKRKNLSSLIPKILEKNLRIKEILDEVKDFQDKEILVPFEDPEYNFSTIPYLYWDSKRRVWIKNDYQLDYCSPGVVYQATFSRSI